MTRKKVFSKIAEAFLTPYAERTEEQHKLAEEGLCDAVQILSKGRTVFYLYFRKFAQELKPSEINHYWFQISSKKTFRYTNYKVKHKREYDIIRGMFASFMSTVSQEEYYRLIRPINRGQ